jgi:hypothetical protein
MIRLMSSTRFVVPPRTILTFSLFSVFQDATRVRVLVLALDPVFVDRG